MGKLAKYLLIFLSGGMTVLGQSYPPAAGLPGSTAIANNSPLFTAWATGITVTRGYVSISNPSFTASGSNYATAGLPEYALGYVDGNSVSLGDAGSAILTFALPITDGNGFDFAVFEAGTNDYLELAFVEVSSDGTNYFRFPGHSQTQASTQVGTFGSPMPQYLNNLAGKYGGTYGTPFDLSDIPDNPLLDKSNVTHVKIIDVTGSINPTYASYDVYSNAINESFPTPFASCGFDLQGVGVIHQKILNAEYWAKSKLRIYPNPTKDYIYVEVESECDLSLSDLHGRICISSKVIESGHLDITSLPAGVYILNVQSKNQVTALKIIKQ